MEVRKKKLLQIFDKTNFFCSTQQQSIGYSSSFGGQGQQPVSSGFFIQSNQDNDQVPVTNAVFMSSQVPPQRFISQSQPKQQIFNNGW